MLDFEQIAVAFKLIELVRKNPRLVLSTESFGDWLQHLEHHLEHSLEE